MVGKNGLVEDHVPGNMSFVVSNVIADVALMSWRVSEKDTVGGAGSEFSGGVRL